MNLYIVRHAIAVEAGTAGYEDDNLRPLTDKGRRKMEKIAHGLKSLETELDLILTSPAVRATETANIMRKAFGLPKEALIETEHLALTGAAAQLIQWLEAQAMQCENIALVGHEPYLSGLVSVLISGRPDAAITLKKGSVCRLTVDTLQYGHCAVLDWLLTPAQLVKLSE